jgi:hypothetical protein
MDPVSGLKAELFRPLTTVLVPGLLAIAPFTAIAFARFPKLEALLSSSLGMSALLLFLGVLSGMLMEDFGSRIELFLWRCFSGTPERDEEWAKYLQLKTTDEIVGQRYLKTVHLRLKFELSMVPALIMFAAGGLWYNDLYGNISQRHIILATLIIINLVFYLLYEANSSIVLLADTRKHVIAACHSSTDKRLEINTQRFNVSMTATESSSKSEIE